MEQTKQELQNYIEYKKLTLKVELLKEKYKSLSVVAERLGITRQGLRQKIYRNKDFKEIRDELEALKLFKN